MDDTNNQQERQIDLAWLAGILEGEGNFSLVRGSGRRIFPRVLICNTDFALIEEACKILKDNNIGNYVQLRTGGCNNNPKHKDTKYITIAGVKRVNSFVKHIKPFIRAHKQAIVQIIESWTDRRLELPRNASYTNVDLNAVKAVRALNQKGKSVSSETLRWPLDWALKTRAGNLREDIVQVA